MIHDRIGTAIMVAAAGWMASLALTDPGTYAPEELRRRIIVTALGLLLLAVFPRHLNLTGTVLAFAMLGLCLNIGLFGLFGRTWEGLLPVALLLVAIWLRRARLDSDPVVVVSAAMACMVALVQPTVILIALTVIVVVNVFIWITNVVRGRTGAA